MIIDWKNAWEEKNKSFDNYKRDVIVDIREMLLLIASFTQEHTEGERLLDEWNEKYGKKD